MAPAAMSYVSRQTGPSRLQIPGGIRVSHSELIADIASSQNFNTFSIQINPGLGSFSPWLSAESLNYDQYRMVSLVAEYRPTCGSGNSGSMMMAFDYDPSDAPPLTRQAMSTYAGAIDSAPWVGTKMSMDAKAVHATGPRKYLRTGPVSGDLRTYDSGQLLTAQNGGPALPIGWGELWLHYTFELLVSTSPTFPLSTQLFGWTNGAAQVVPPASNADVVWPLTLTNFHGDIAQNGTDTIFTLPETSVVIMVNLQLAQGFLPIASFQATISLRINGLALISQFVFISSVAASNQIQSVNFAYPIIAPGGTTVDVYVQNPSATGSLSILPGASFNLLCV